MALQVPLYLSADTLERLKRRAASDGVAEEHFEVWLWGDLVAAVLDRLRRWECEEAARAPTAASPTR